MITSEITKKGFGVILFLLKSLRDTVAATGLEYLLKRLWMFKEKLVLVSITYFREEIRIEIFNNLYFFRSYFKL